MIVVLFCSARLSNRLTNQAINPTPITVKGEDAPAGGGVHSFEFFDAIPVRSDGQIERAKIIPDQRQNDSSHQKRQLRAATFEGLVANEQAGHNARLQTPNAAARFVNADNAVVGKRMTLVCCTAGIPRSFRASTSSVVIISFRATKDQ
jgi:hypothetical protein